MLTGLIPAGGEVGLEDLVVDYLTKPFTVEALLKMVASAFTLLDS
jgi:CheY-like chemotaxis protein